MSSIKAEERLSLARRWGATLFAGVAGLYGESPHATQSAGLSMAGAGLQFIVKPAQRLLVNLEYAQGLEGNCGVYLKFGYAW
jgi:hypothetical protein